MCILKLAGEIFVLMGKMFYEVESLRILYTPLYCYNIFNVRDCLLDLFLKMREGLWVGEYFVLLGKICSEVE